MQIREYIFRSPYPNRIQVGVPDTSLQQNNQSTKQTTKIEQQQTQTDIKKSQIKTLAGDKKLTPDINLLNLYA